MREKQCLVLSIVSVLNIAMACSKPSYELLKTPMSVVKSKNEVQSQLVAIDERYALGVWLNGVVASGHRVGLSADMQSSTTYITATHLGEPTLPLLRAFNLRIAAQLGDSLPI